MSNPWPASPAPSYYSQCSFPTRNGVFYSDGSLGAPSVTLSKSGATNYAVYDYYYNEVSSGSFSGTTCTPTAPSGGWKPGWYRIYFTGANTDALFGPSYGATNFCVIRPNANFVAMPAVGVAPIINVGGSSANLDSCMRAVMGCGCGRFFINDATNPTVASGTGGNISNNQIQAGYFTAYSNVDSARPIAMFCEFPNGAYDILHIAGSGGRYLECLATSGSVAANGNDVFVSVSGVSGAACTVEVFYPNTSTLVETWNVTSAANAVSQINGVSAYIWVVIPFVTPVADPTALAATAIGNAFYNGVVETVQALYPYGITYFEGPLNEPTLSLVIPQAMKLFQAAVHAGNASAIALGPAPLNISTLTGLDSWTTFLAAGGAAYCDEISFHDYNTTVSGDLNEGRTQIVAFLALLASFSVTQPLWQTEATNVFNSVNGVYHPRRSRVVLLMTLLWEQYGIPRERNPVWYDFSHGFWSYPAFLEAADSSLSPYAVLFRVLAEETWGQTHNQILDFGTPGNNIYVGSVYTGGGTSTAVIQCASYMPSNTVTLAVSGTTGSLTVVDGFGNSSSVAITNGLAVIPVGEVPTYVQLPSGASVTVHACRDWAGVLTNRSLTSAATIGGVSNSVINSGNFMTAYPGNETEPGVAFSTGSLPGDTAEVSWSSAQVVNRVIIWCGGAWQDLSALSDFDVQTSVDGTTWVTQETVTKTNVSSFNFGSDSSNSGCAQETFWDEQWIFDVEFNAVSCKAVRIYVRATSCGGEPDTAATTAGGQGNPVGGAGVQQLTLQSFQAMYGASTVVVLPPGSQTLVHT